MRFRSLTRRVVPALAVALPLALLSCGKGEKPLAADASGETVLVEVGDSALRLRDVERRIPGGLAEADSAALFAGIVDSWVERMLLADLGAGDPDEMERIERLTADYRNRLIMESYRRREREAGRREVKPDSVRRFYESHKEQFVLESPLVKGLYVKVPDNSPRLDDIRRWIFAGTPEGVDNLEKYGLGDAVQYAFFEDRWVDFRTVTDRIPYRFYDADAFVESTPKFETSYDGMTYLLYISSFLPGGSPMPADYAERLIRTRLQEEDAAAYEKRLVASLREEAEREGRLRTPGYDLRTGSLRRSATPAATKPTR